MKYFFFISALLLLSCNSKPGKLTGHDIEIFEGTKVWNLAKAVERGDIPEIRRLANKSNIDVQDTSLGMTLLDWAVVNKHYNAAKALAESGANPNIECYEDPASAMTDATHDWDTSAYVRLLIENGGNVNAVIHRGNVYTTPLFGAVSWNFESAKLLVKAGADVNYVSPDSFNAIIMSVNHEQFDILHYLVIDCHEDFKKPAGMTNRIFHWFNNDHFLEDTTDYKLKLEVVEYMKQNGADYYEYLSRYKKK